MPKSRQGDSGTSTTTPTQITTAGTSMLPVPRIALASAFMIQMKILPEKTTLEYASAAVSSSPRPPSAR